MTKQEFQAECDINNIIKQFSATGVIRHISAKAAEGAYQDLPDPIEFQDGLHIVQQATESFMTLPAKVRARFENDPASFLAFMAEPGNAEEIKTMGLTNPLPQAPAPVRVIMDPLPDLKAGEAPPKPQGPPGGGSKAPA